METHSKNAAGSVCLVTFARSAHALGRCPSLSRAHVPSQTGKGKAMEDFLTSFFITPFTGLAEGIASATSPLDVIDAVDGFVWGRS